MKKLNALVAAAALMSATGLCACDASPPQEKVDKVKADAKPAPTAQPKEPAEPTGDQHAPEADAESLEDDKPSPSAAPAGQDDLEDDLAPEPDDEVEDSDDAPTAAAPGAQMPAPSRMVEEDDEDEYKYEDDEIE